MKRGLHDAQLAHLRERARTDHETALRIVDELTVQYRIVRDRANERGDRLQVLAHRAGVPEQPRRLRQAPGDPRFRRTG